MLTYNRANVYMYCSIWIGLDKLGLKSSAKKNDKLYYMNSHIESMCAISFDSLMMVWPPQDKDGQHTIFKSMLQQYFVIYCN